MTTAGTAPAASGRSGSRRSERARRVLAARRARRRGAMVFGAVVAAGLVVGLAGVGGTYSYLSAQAASGASVVKAGTLNLTIDGAQSASLASFALAPNVWQVRSVTIMNTGDAPAALTAAAAVTSADPLAADVVMRLTTVASGSTCTAGASAPTAPLAGFASALGSLAPGGSTVLCVEVGLRPGTSADRSGQSAAFQLTVTAEQQAG